MELVNVGGMFVYCYGSSEFLTLQDQFVPLFSQFSRLQGHYGHSCPKR